MTSDEYRRAVGTKIWHWNPNCQHWPTKAYGISPAEPVDGQRCKECGAPPAKR